MIPDDPREPLGAADPGEPEVRIGDAGAGYDMCFTVLDRGDGRVHLVSEGGGEVFGHPSVSEAVWERALCDVPEAWRIVDLSAACPAAGAPRVPMDDDALAERQYERLLALLRAGFDRDEALEVLLALLRAEGPPG